MGADLSEVRRKAWKTRRKLYGRRGHSGCYLTGRRCPRCQVMEMALVRLHAEGALSEGQVSKMTQLDRVEVRKLVDRLRDQRRIEFSDEMSRVKQHETATCAGPDPNLRTANTGGSTT
jgi:hypothetical protein